MIKVTDKTYFDYLDDLLSPEDIQSFEDYIANNPEAKLKLDKLLQEEQEFNKKIKDPNYPKITDKFSKEMQEMQESLDLNKSKKNILGDFFFKEILFLMPKI